MKNHYLLLLVMAVVAGCQSSADHQSYLNSSKNKPAEVIAGPMLGYTEHREALVWLQVSTGAPVDLYLTDSTGQAPRSFLGSVTEQTGVIKYHLTGLQPSTTYTYYFSGVADTFSLSTRDLWEWRHYPKDFSFLMGSCNYVNDSLHDRPGKPYGQGTEIFKTMAREEADWMIWLGDNTYLREADWSTPTGVYHRYSHTRADSNMQPLLANMRHLATWDDHDYGPNDADVSYPLKATTLQAFKNYWGNQHYGLPDVPGVFSRVAWNDVEFYLLDNRYYRSPNDMKDDDPNKQYLGPQQMNWLKNSLLSSSSKFSFRFIICGNQVLNPANEYECYRHYEREWNELIDFVVDNQIPGVVFLSGDRHFTEINRYTPKGGYTLYDVTSSPLSSRPYSTIIEHEEFNNPARVDSTLLNELNYVKATISGDYKNADRKITFTAHDKTGTQRWQYTIHQQELQFE